MASVTPTLTSDAGLSRQREFGNSRLVDAKVKVLDDNVDIGDHPSVTSQRDSRMYESSRDSGARLSECLE
jgi:hypothetical protein